MVQYNVQRKAIEQKKSSNSSTRTVQLRYNNVESIIQMAKMNPEMLTQNDVMVLQKTMGNSAVSQLMKGVGMNDDAGVEKEADVMGKQSDEVRLNNNTIVKDTCVQLVIGKETKHKKSGHIPLRIHRASRTGGYKRGTHGFKKREQNRLGTSGKTHESEHTVGFEVINRTSGENRGDGERARRLENNAPAYQEVKRLHREHIGTGTSMKPDASGFNSQSYRDAQRSLIENGDVSSAVQLNQLGYAFNPEFHGNDGKLVTADDSFSTMVENMKEVQYANGAVDQSVSVSPKQRAEMYLSRIAARTGKWPTTAEIDEAKKKFGIDPKQDVTMG